MGTRFDEDVYVNGNLQAASLTLPANAVVDASVAAGAGIGRAKLALETKVYVIPWESWKVFDAFQSPLPATSVLDDLGLYGGVHGTDVPLIKSYDVMAAGALAIKARCLFQLPPEYAAGGAVSLRVRAKVDAVADGSATIDFAAFKGNREGLVTGADVVATAATSINSATFADKSFTITPTTLGPGDVLDVLMTLDSTDTAGVSPVIASLGEIALLLAVRG